MEIEPGSTVFSKEIETLLTKEREARLNNDYNESARILVEIVNFVKTIYLRKRLKPHTILENMLNLTSLSLFWLRKEVNQRRP